MEVTDGVREIRCRFSAAAYDGLLELARIQNTRMSRALADAIGLSLWCERERASGNMILVKRGDEVREVLGFPPDPAPQPTEGASEP
jgi:hypothetical protein